MSDNDYENDSASQMREAYEKAFRNSPQMTRVGVLSWSGAGFYADQRSSYLALPYELFKITEAQQFQIKHISEAERKLGLPVYEQLAKNPKSPINFLRYIWLDAVGTSGLALSIYQNSLRTSGVKYPRLLALSGYPIVLIGGIIKLVLAILAIPTVIVGSILNRALRGNESDIATTIRDTVMPVALGLIVSVRQSNLNPFFLGKSLFVDPVSTYRRAQEINAGVAERKTKSVTEAAQPSPSRRSPSPELTKPPHPPVVFRKPEEADDFQIEDAPAAPTKDNSTDFFDAAVKRASERIGERNKNDHNKV